MMLKEIIMGKKILFITTKNIDYIRNTQEIRMLEKNALSVEVISSNNRNYLTRIFSIWKQIKRERILRNDIIFVGFAPQLIIPFFTYKLSDKPIIIDFFISVYDTFICDRKKFKKDGLVSKIFHKLDEITLNRANLIIADTKAHADFFASEFNVDKSFFEIIYLEADSKIYFPRAQNKIECLKDKFVVLYFGSILPLQGVEIVLDTMREFREYTNIYFDIIGPIPDKYKKPIQNNVVYTEWLPQELLAEHIANADLCLAGHFSGEIDKAMRTIPGKASIYEMMNKTMILGDNNANHELYLSDERHFFVEMGNTESLIALIKSIEKAV